MITCTLTLIIIVIIIVVIISIITVLLLLLPSTMMDYCVLIPLRVQEAGGRFKRKAFSALPHGLGFATLKELR
jgi:hypothetical protein